MKCAPVHHGIPAVLHRDEPWLHRHSENGALGTLSECQMVWIQIRTGILFTKTKVVTDKVRVKIIKKHLQKMMCVKW